MGQVLNIPSAGMDYMIYGDNREVLSNYLYNQLQQLPNTLTDFGMKVYDTIANSYNYITDQFTQNNIFNALASQNVNVSFTGIEEITSYEALQHANISMQRFIMANPTIRQLYVDQNCAGYPDTYKDIFNKAIGKDHYDYRRVTDGIVMDTEDGWEVNYYHERLETGDKELDFHDKVKILNSWSASDWLIENCKFDFTNPDGDTKFNV